MRTYKLPAALVALILEGDETGLLPDEINAFEQFCEKEKIDSSDLTLINTGTEPYFSEQNDMNDIAGNVFDFLHCTDEEIQLIRDAQNAFNVILEPKCIRVGIQMWPLCAFEYSIETGKHTATIPTIEGCDLSELFMSVVDFYIDNSGLFHKEEKTVFLAQETDAWFGTNDRNIIGIYTSQERALLSAMKHTGEVLRAENGGYKSIREEYENGVFITQYGLDQEIGS